MARKPSTATNDQPELFSTVLKQWLHKRSGRTLKSLSELFAEKSFALLFLLLMALPALPLPTGGVTHVTEIIVALLCLELIIGRRTVWLPQKWLHKNLGRLLNKKAANRLISVVEWFERKSRRRGSRLLVQRSFLSLIGFIILIFTVAAFIAPPFSGLDTLPSLAVVILSLGLILEDLVIVIFGVLVGLGGIALEVIAGSAVYSGLHHFF